MSFRRISILGLGLIGGSIALAVRERISDCQIKGYDLDAEALKAALASRAIHQTTDNLELACKDAECIILCVPVGQMGDLLGRVASHVKPGVCITDVSSTKQAIVAQAQRLLPAGVHFVGAHPMAGRELSGFPAARANLFYDALCITTPDYQTNSNALDQVEELWRSLGAKIRRLSPAEHDRMVAQVSHLPHLLASALVSAISDEAMTIAGPGFRDVTRIAASDGALWRDILLDNAVDVRLILQQLKEELDRVDAMLELAKSEELQMWLDAAASRRRAITRPVPKSE